MPEFDLIQHLQQTICIPPGCERHACAVGIGDDGAVLEIPGGRQLVVCTDTLVAGVHFPSDTSPDAIGYKALAVNLSDLAAMGAEPAWVFMALTLPDDDTAWLSAYADAMARLANETGTLLAGGDITTGPLSICITALGLVDENAALVRSGARPGDLIVVSGALGAAANALRVLAAGGDPDEGDLTALEFPVARLSLGRALAGIATSCIDISDGLAADLGHILEQSSVGAEVDLARLPCPPGLEGLPTGIRWPLQLAGGDDYELCFTVPAASLPLLDAVSQDCAVPLTPVGVITDRLGLELKTPGGERFELPAAGYEHFVQAKESQT
jgi:thiamine-monophosphate kinase